MAGRGEVSLEPAGDGTLIAHLSGDWTLENPLPSVEPVRESLDRDGVRRLGFETSGLGNWDSALVTFVVAVTDLAREHQAAVDAGGLPEGVQRLLRLAAAVSERPGVRRRDERASLVSRVGAKAIEVVQGQRDAVAFLGEVALSCARFAVGRARMRGQDLLLFVQECGAEALPIVTLISVLVGMILAFVGAVQLQKFGAQIYVADLVAIAMVREMGCIMTAIIMAGRTGSGFAAQLGTMKVTQEIDAFATLGIPPMDFLVLPRMLALVIMMPLLTIYSDLLGILGGGLVSVGMLDLTPFQYVNESKRILDATDCATGIGKSFVFGALVAFAGCLRGMQCGKSSSAVGEAATSAVVTSIVLIVVADGMFAVVFNVLHI
jgi:phospholipid/cholesterol/gamma-HCH transport system permease protein